MGDEFGIHHKDRRFGACAGTVRPAIPVCNGEERIGFRLYGNDLFSYVCTPHQLIAKGFKKMVIAEPDKTERSGALLHGNLE